MDIEPLRSWFLRERREFPWRKEISPYRVWVSEVMLQQTQARVVIPYFLRWMERFPTIQALASADEAEVIKAWEGLGYYTRARNLHRAAKSIVAMRGGEFPENHGELLQIPGIGLYTAAAILSFAFHQKRAAVDGNVLRVISRLFSIEEPIDQVKTRHRIEELTEELLPDRHPHIVMEALIELGAEVCKKQPECARCPLRAQCRAHRKGTSEKLPIKKRKTVYHALFRLVMVVESGDFYLVRREEEKGLMQGLYQFPYCDSSDSMVDIDLFRERFSEHRTHSLEFKKWLAPVRQSFTRYRVQLLPSLWETGTRYSLADFQWVSKKEIKSLPFCSGHRKILEEIKNLSH